MLSWNSIQDNAVKFSKRWEKAEYEKGEAQSFTNDLFSVFGIDRLRVANFEYKSPKSGGRIGFIDLFWKGRIIIEMKSAGASLDKAYNQAKDYAFNIKNDEDLPKLIMVCDFKNIKIYNLISGQIFSFKTKQLSKHVKKFAILTEYAEKYSFIVNKKLNNTGAENMAKLHDLLESHGYKGHNLKVYLVRLLFILFSDTSGIFEKGLFRYYILKSKGDGSDLSSRLFKLFDILNTSLGERNKRDLLTDELKKFVYVNGSLFEELIPPADFDSKMRELLLECCSFDWSTISPAIFGSLFQGVMDKKERRNLGVHYTSEENILRLIKPLFLNELYKEFEKVKMYSNQLNAFHEKIANLKFLDPACGCGNFLIIAYRELRLLELEVLKMKLVELHGNLPIEEELKVNVNQFYGIEYEEFPSRIAQVAMWIIDHQMNNLIAVEFGVPFNRVPLKKSATIKQGNALEIDWNSVVLNHNLDYIIGNPPFVGTKYQDEQQKLDMKRVCQGFSKTGVLDYVTGWFIKAADYINYMETKVAFVATNSITQGEQVPVLWNILFNSYKVEIQFAYKTFIWKNDAPGRAAVHCVIIAFHKNNSKIEKYIFEGDIERKVKNISPYLIEGGHLLIESRRKPIVETVPLMNKGSQPTDGGYLILDEEEKDELLKKNPLSEKYIRPYMGATDFINSTKRWCLWLVDCPPNELKKMPDVLKRLEKVKESRLFSKKRATRDKAGSPALFTEIRQPKTDYLLVPVVSTKNREYLPIGFVNKDVIANTNALVIPNAEEYHFGVLSSSLHMLWMRTVCGRMKSDYAYSASVVYNNFPWPIRKTETTKRIEECAQSILSIREKYFPKNSLADLYNSLTMPLELRKAHVNLDKAVKNAYGFANNLIEDEILEKLFAMYSKIN